jgi:hypothetical protein
MQKHHIATARRAKAADGLKTAPVRKGDRLIKEKTKSAARPRTCCRGAIPISLASST